MYQRVDTTSGERYLIFQKRITETTSRLKRSSTKVRVNGDGETLK
jgi:hypothetical protein